ncbi:MAG: hypothetical protein ACFBSF_11065 [Leptolyngbyaceae cyanobacterium]
MKAVFDPKNLLISEANWHAPQKRDDFLQHLLDNLDVIRTYKIATVYWTDELEEVLWEHPQLPPWRLDRDWRLPLVQVIYKAFSTLREPLQNTQKLPPCLVQPALACEDLGEAILPTFLELMHIVIEKNEPVFFCLGIDRAREDYRFSCSCHAAVVHPQVIASPHEWLDHVDLTTDYWPQTIHDIDKFNTILDVTLKKIDKESIYEYEFTTAFLRDIIKTEEHRDAIAEYIAKRLTLTRQEAARDPYLQDEYLAQKDEHRFRVTQRPFSTRIHYQYIDGKFRFLRYYDRGEHDMGL